MRTRKGSRRRTVILFSIGILVLLALSGLTEFLLYRARLERERVEEYHEAAADDWKKTVELSNGVGAALTGVGSPEDLANVAGAANTMMEEIVEVLEVREKDRPPSVERDVADAEKECLISLYSYLEMVSESASSGDENVIKEARALLETRAAQALSKVSDFMNKAGFIEVGISGGFYRADESLANAFRPPEWQNKEEEVAFELVNTFMEADIKEYKPEVIRSLSSSNRLQGLALVGVTEENFAEVWRGAWGKEKHPVDYYVSGRGIEFPDPNTAEVEVTVHLEDGAPWSAKVRLVKEADGWKVDGYPFVGWR
jgi:hypothetical protein